MSSRHIVDQIADYAVDLFVGQTAAQERVSRDRDPSEPFDLSTELPAIDVRIGEDNPVDAQVVNFWTSEVQLNVDLYAAHGSKNVSERLLELRRETYQLLMAGAPRLPGVPDVLQILPGGATEVAKLEQGKVPTGYLRTVWFITYRHSLTDPAH